MIVPDHTAFDTACVTADALAAARADLFRQAQAACALGSPFVRDVLSAASRQLHRAPQTALVMATWSGDRAAAALALRLNAALHTAARAGLVPSLSALYARRGGDADRAVADAFVAIDRLLAARLTSPTQTNAVARSAALFAALMVAAETFSQPFELLEPGASAGLNLHCSHYSYALGGTAAGDPASMLHLAPRWRGAAPRRHAVRVIAAYGADCAPLDPADPDDCERLLSFVWADRDDHAAQLVAAIRLARQSGPRVERAEATQWLAERLARPQPGGVTRAVMHSMLRQYLSAEARSRFDAVLAAAGARADARHPLAHVSYEWNAERTCVELVLTTWPGGERRLLAHPDPYGDAIDWRA